MTKNSLFGFNKCKEIDKKAMFVKIPDKRKFSKLKNSSLQYFKELKAIKTSDVSFDVVRSNSSADF